MHRWITLLAVFASPGCVPSEDQKLVGLEWSAEQAVRAILRDPESARFSEVVGRLENRSVCGKVNSKNGFGGYTGPEHFAYWNGDVAVGSEDPALLPLMKKCTDGAEIEARRATAALERELKNKR